MAKISQTTSHEDSASDSEGWTAINIPSSTPESTSAVPLTESTDFPMPPQASFTSLLTRPRTSVDTAQFRARLASIESPDILNSAKKERLLLRAVYDYLSPVRDQLDERHRIAREENHDLWNGRNITTPELLQDTEKMTHVGRGSLVSRNKFCELLNEEVRRQDRDFTGSKQFGAEGERMRILKRQRMLLEGQAQLKKATAEREARKIAYQSNLGLGQIMSVSEDEEPASSEPHKREVDSSPAEHRWNTLVFRERFVQPFMLLLCLWYITGQISMVLNFARPSMTTAVHNGTDGLNGTLPVELTAVVKVKLTVPYLESVAVANLGSSSVSTSTLSSLANNPVTPVSPSTAFSTTTSATSITTAESTTIPGISVWWVAGAGPTSSILISKAPETNGDYVTRV